MQSGKKKDRELHITASDVSISDSPLSDSQELAIMYVKVHLLRLPLPSGLRCVYMKKPVVSNVYCSTEEIIYLYILAY